MLGSTWRIVLLLSLLCILSMQPAGAFEFYLNQNAKLCFAEQLPSNTKVFEIGVVYTTVVKCILGQWGIRRCR